MMFYMDEKMPYTTKLIKISLLLFSASFAIIAVIPKKFIQHFPNSADEYTYVSQATSFAQGKVYRDTHPKNNEGRY